MGVRGRHAGSCVAATVCRRGNKTQGEGAEEARGREAGREGAVCEAAVATASWRMTSIFFGCILFYTFLPTRV